MSFPQMTFPLTVDFGSAGYWIGNQGPFKYGAAVTAFFIGEDIGEVSNDGIPLMYELERHLQTFGSHLKPYVREQEVDAVQFFRPESSAVDCSVCLVLRPIEGSVGMMAERWTFSCLRDFLYMELGKSIEHGNAPRQCRLCGRWFLHEQGDRMMYCERTAPGETEQTCREIGARAVFEKKIQDEEAWKLYKRAYKKYYARVMKGNMSRDEFNDWVRFAMSQRDATIFFLAGTEDPKTRIVLIEQLREELNRQ